jgi:hypothetical protein
VQSLPCLVLDVFFCVVGLTKEGATDQSPPLKRRVLRTTQRATVRTSRKNFVPVGTSLQALLKVGPAIPSARLENGETLCCCKQQTNNKKKESLLCSRESKRCSLGLLILVTMVAGNTHCGVLDTPVWVERKESARPCKKGKVLGSCCLSEVYSNFYIFKWLTCSTTVIATCRWMLISMHHGQLMYNASF